MTDFIVDGVVYDMSKAESTGYHKMEDENGIIIEDVYLHGDHILVQTYNMNVDENDVCYGERWHSYRPGDVEYAKWRQIVDEYTTVH